MVARVSESSLAHAVGALVGVGVDLGRHRSFAALAAHSYALPLPLSAQDDGLLIRWVGDGGPQRVPERIFELSGVDQSEAERFVGLVASQIIRGIPAETSNLPAETDLTIRKLAIPASFGPQCRQAVLAGFQRAGVDLQPENLVERPIAALAGWFAHRQRISGRPTRDPVLLIDNDGGELSAVIADPLTRRLLACMPLSSGPNDNPAWVVEGLKDLITLAAGMLHREGLIQDTDWPSISSTLPQVVVTGSGHSHPAIVSLVRSLLPAADVMPDPLVADPAHCVALGLQHLDQFDSWRACWPTSAIHLPGVGVSVVDAGQVLYRQNESYVVRPGAELQFGRVDRPLQLRSGSTTSTGLIVPPAMGPLPLMRLLPDGRMSIRGAKGVRPLTVQLSWPCPGSDSQELKISTIGRRAANLA